MNRSRIVEFAFLLPWVGVFLLTPPVVIVWQTWSRAAGFPLFIVYIFVCWLALIVTGGLVARRLEWPVGTRARNAAAREGDER
jgi:hypothetical protein